MKLSLVLSSALAFLVAQAVAVDNGSLRRLETGIPGDNCANATPLEVKTNEAVTVSGSTIGAARDSHAPDFCDTATWPGVWYSLKVRGRKKITVSTCNQAEYDTMISIFKNTCDDLECVLGQDDSYGCSEFTTEVETFNPSEVVTLYILVHGYCGATGNFELTVTLDSADPKKGLCGNDARDYCQEVLGITTNEPQGLDAVSLGECQQVVCGKKELPVSCENRCGGPGGNPYIDNGGCYCDGLCTFFGDCCDDYSDFCA